MKEETPKILIVDDIVMNVDMLKNIVEARGYTALCALSVQEAAAYFKTDRPSLILSDWSMPEIDGMQFCHMMKSNPETKDIPFIFISVLDTAEEKERAFKAGAVDFINKPFDPTEVIMRVDNHLNSYRMKQEMEDYNRMLHKLVEKQQKKIQKEQERVLSVLTKLMEKREGNTGRNLKNIGRNCRFLAHSLQLLPQYENVITDEFADAIEVAGKLYDLGSFLERLVMDNGKSGQTDRQRTVRNVSFLEELAEGEKSDLLVMALNIAQYRFSRWDGTGYPGCGGGEIPLEARIVALADDFDTLVGKPDDTQAAKEAVRRIDEQSGSLYDPGMVKVLDKVWQKMVADWRER